MGHRVLEYSEKTISDLGVEPGVPYAVEGKLRHDGLDQVGSQIQYRVGQTMMVLPLGLHFDTQGLVPGDTLEFQVEIMPLRLGSEQLKKLGVRIGQKFVVHIGEDKNPRTKSGPYVEVGGEKVYLFNLRSNFNPHIDETRAGEILTVMGYWDRVEDLPKE